MKGDGMDIEITEAKREDKDFIVLANKEIDKASFIESSKLAENIDKDIFEDKLAVCLIAKDREKSIGMVLFSKVYWADRGEGIYVSQAYVVPEYRKSGVFKLLINKTLNYYNDTKFLTCLVAKENFPMVNCMKAMKFEDENMISYAKNKSDFD